MVGDYAQDMLIKQIPPQLALGSLLFTRLGEWLTGEARAKQPMLRDDRGADFSQVTKWLHAKVLLVQAAQRAVDLACENAAVTKTPQVKVKSSQPRKQVYEIHADRRRCTHRATVSIPPRSPSSICAGVIYATCIALDGA